MNRQETRPSGRSARQTLAAALLLAAYVAITALPVLLAWGQGFPARPWPDELSSALAMTSLMVLAVEFALSGRFRGASSPVGIDAVMRMHQLIARPALVYLLVHPMMYTLPLAVQPWDDTRAATLALTPAATVTGMAAWVLMALLVPAAIFRDRIPYRYETWRLAHALGAAALMALAIHHALDAGRYSGAAPLGWMWWLAAALCALALVHVWVLRPWAMSRKPYLVTRLERIAPRTWTLALRAEGHPGCAFRAGQFAWIKAGSAWRFGDHPFSIASAPAQRPEIEFLIKEAGDFTGSLPDSVPPGSRVFLDAPYGHFTLEGRDGEGIMLIAGGVGFAPVLSLLRELAARGERRPVILVFGNRIAEQIVFERELRDIAAKIDLRTHFVLGEPPAGWTGISGQLDPDTLRPLLPARPEGWLYFVCGPTPMIDAVEHALDRAGVPLAQIVAERFRYDSGSPGRRERRMLAAFAAVAAANLAVALAFALRS
ncbi:ferredoxin reductase family protein [Burkholderiaceae bacterium FT117]|uniref:ferredoxin reductase family protein n=1 Tax=Zeimonas sediminis TaxID=2944268 RepID=UPI002342FB9B|nr:ferredoxin reductase family protein [Zeimonas sediminis]MCM5571163.1 ferredoxin reductase family protein [Zeimonas sediminis]